MRWFKHLSAASEDEKQAELIDRHGSDGYGIYWMILEKIAAKMEKGEDRTNCRYSANKWANICGKNPRGMRKFYETFEYLSLFIFKRYGKHMDIIPISYAYELDNDCKSYEYHIDIDCPNLLKFRDEYSKKSGQTPDKLRTDSGQTPDQETETETETEDYSEDSNEFRLSLFLLNNIRKRKPDFKIPNLQSWSKQSDYILRIDRRDIGEAKEVIVWCQSDEFWQDNILSTAKLRKQYDQLVLKMNKETKKEPEQSATMTAIPGAIRV